MQLDSFKDRYEELLAEHNKRVAKGVPLSEKYKNAWDEFTAFYDNAVNNYEYLYKKDIYETELALRRARARNELDLCRSRAGDHYYDIIEQETTTRMRQVRDDMTQMAIRNTQPTNPPKPKEKEKDEEFSESALVGVICIILTLAGAVLYTYLN